MKYKCMKCDDIVESSPERHKMNWCSCGNLGVDNHYPPNNRHRVVGDCTRIRRVGAEMTIAEEMDGFDEY